MENMRALPAVLLLLGSLPGLPSALPMTDYSQLNHDEPTHWTKAATTESSATERAWNVLSKVRKHLGSEPKKHPSSTAPTPNKTLPVILGNGIPEEREPEEVVRNLTSGLERFNRTLSGGVEEKDVQIVEQMGEEERRLAEGTTERKEEVISSTSSSTTEPTEINPDAGYSNYIDGNVGLEENKNYIEEEFGRNDIKRAKNRSNESPDHFYRYDLIEDIKNLFTSDNEGKKEDGKEVEEERDDYKSPDFRSPLPTYKTILVHKVEDIGFDSEQEEEEMKKDEGRSSYDGFALPTMENGDDSYDSETPFKEWDRDSEEQEKILENIVLQTNNETNRRAEEEKAKSLEEHSGRWFILLLAGNSTIVRLRQKDFKKYLKLNLAARLSLEYDELRVNRVVLAPPRLMVNVSVVPSEAGNLDDEFDLNERLFGEEEAPLHKLAETNATLLELSGEEYHVVRFLSLRSEQPVSLDEVASETSVVVTDKHTDIEKVIYIGVGGACIIVILPLIFALCRLYVLPRKIKWPWKRDKPLFVSPWTGPRHQRMEEPAPVGGPLTVIYSGSFVERNGPPSGSWLEDNYQNSSILQEEPTLENPVYGYSALNRNILPEICDPTILESPRFNIDSKLHILGCRPNHLLLPHTPLKRNEHKNILDVRIPKGVDNPNYQT